MAKGANTVTEGEVLVGKKEVKYFSTVMGGGVGQDAPAEVKRKVDGYLSDGWEMVYTLMVDHGNENKGLNIYHVFTR